MSHQQAKIKFDSDGLVMFAEYDGTNDWILTPIYRTVEDLREGWRSGDYRECSCGRAEPAEYAETYGGGSHGPVKACRYCLAIVDFSAWQVGDDLCDGPNGGLPDWY